MKQKEEKKKRIETDVEWLLLSDLYSFNVLLIAFCNCTWMGFFLSCFPETPKYGPVPTNKSMNICMWKTTQNNVCYMEQDKLDRAELSLDGKQKG